MTLGLRIRRPFFEALLAQAVPSSFAPTRRANEQAWKDAVAGSDVRQQWDPDHAPDGSKLERRAIQLGLRGDALRALAGRELLGVIDMPAFVDAQRGAALGAVANLQTPVEQVLKSGS